MCWGRDRQVDVVRFWVSDAVGGGDGGGLGYEGRPLPPCTTSTSAMTTLSPRGRDPSAVSWSGSTSAPTQKQLYSSTSTQRE